MPFNDPGAGGEFVELDEGWYTAKVTDLEEKEGKNDNYGKGPSNYMCWHLNLQDEGGTVIVDDRGFPLDKWVTTSLSLSNKGAVVAKGRIMMDAFLARPIGDDEQGLDLSAEVIGKKALVYFGTDPKSGRTVPQIWKPTPGAKAPAAAARGRAPAAAPADPGTGSDPLKQVPF